MVWSLETDDRKGLCGAQNILTETIKAELENGVSTPQCPVRGDDPPPTPSTPPPPVTPSTTSKPDDGANFKCVQAGKFPYPGNCAKYIECTSSLQRHDRDCPTGTLWNNPAQICDFPANVNCPDRRRFGRNKKYNRKNKLSDKFEWRHVKVDRHYQ